MATKIGSNFDYKGPLFLDARQGLGTEPLDLRKWNVLVPDGFLTFVSGCWYIYDPSIPESTETGKFHPLFDNELGDRKNISLSQFALQREFKDVRDYISNVEDQVQLPIIHIQTGGGVFEPGENVIPSISWTVEKGGKEVLPDHCLVNGSLEGLSPDLTRYISYTPITKNTSYSILIQVGNSLVSTVVDYSFISKRYYGVFGETTITSLDILDLEYYDQENTNILKETRFDCLGGKYPWFCIPTNVFNDINNHVGCWINGIKMSDTVSTEVNVENSYGVVVKYTCIRLGYIQTGNILMEFK